MTAEPLIFFFLAAFAITSAVLVVVQRNPVVSAIYLIANFFSLAALYLVLRAQLLAVLQIVVYAGAIMVLVIFVIMLLNLGDERSLVERINFRMVVGVTVALAFLLEMLYIFLGIASDGTTPGLHPDAASVGTVESMGEALFGQYVFPFEITSLLLLAAIIGAVVLAKKRDPRA
ncbi:MAG: NADH-quinone oxidoreductase subunit J [Bacteroidota bacterium]